MWIKSLDLIMDKLKITGCDLNSVKSISGSAQQHGTVYWKKGAKQILSNLDSTKISTFTITASVCIARNTDLARFKYRK